MKKLFFVIAFVLVACAGSHDSQSDESKKQKNKKTQKHKNIEEKKEPPTYNPPPSAPADENPGNQEEEKAKEPVEEDTDHRVLVIFNDDGTPFRCWRRDDDSRYNEEFKDAGFKHYYASYNGKTIASQNKLLKVVGLTRLDCCLINKRRLNHLTGKFEMTAGRLAKAKKECAVALQKEEDDLKKIKAEEEDNKEQDEADEPDDDQNE